MWTFGFVRTKSVINNEADFYYTFIIQSAHFKTYQFSSDKRQI